ncbi:MAG TPA: hypothetical protein VL551_34955 [Actinospica sp.]|nr:hypothetical protein [Actinospica sp.]
MSTELYKQEITGPFAKLCGGGTNDGNMEDCVVAAPLEGGGLALRDSKLGEDSPELRFDFNELKSLGDKIATLNA